MKRTGSLSNIVALVVFTALTVTLARLQPVNGIPLAAAADLSASAWSPVGELSPQHQNVIRPGTPDIRSSASDIRARCGKSQVQYHKLDGYRRCLDEQHVSYESTAWCPIVKTFCDAQWYPFGGREQCYTERGCPAS